MSTDYTDFTMEFVTAVVSRDPVDNSEGILAMATDDGPMPLIASDRVREDQLRQMAKGVMDDMPGRKFYLVKFVRVEEIPL